LEEVMSAYPGVPINIEIKGAADSDVESFLHNAEVLADFLNGLGRSEGIIVASFNDSALERFHELAPQIDLAPATGAVAGYKLAGVQPPEGTVAFQVPMEFGGVTVVDSDFIRRAHDDGYAVHVWTIDDKPTMNLLLDWGADGIMSSQPTRLEQVLCSRGVERPPRPASFPGRHCSPRASIACDVEATGAGLAGNGGLRVTLRRNDGFVGRCAGRVALTASSSPGRAVGSFNFGTKPPTTGGGRTKVVRIGLPPALRDTLERGDRVQVSTQPYSSFVERRSRLVR
jgi:hypothetical protein